MHNPCIATTRRRVACCLFALASVLLTSCGGGGPSGTASPPQEPTETATQRRDALKADFATALAEALAASPALRRLIKDEALKMFDRDYDVLYLAIKDRPLADGPTLGERLQSALGHERLAAIETQWPSLTVFVPTLPEDAFSASSWDVQTQVPWVGFTSQRSEDVNLVNGRGERRLVRAEHIPAFPVVVVKENERVVAVGSKGLESAQAAAPGATFRAGNTAFRFTDAAFDGSRAMPARETAAATVYNTDPKLVEAYDIYKGTDGWQRDYIYYDITPEQDRGQFRYDFQERITVFMLKPDPDAMGALRNLTDQRSGTKRDPWPSISERINAGWTDGYFEIRAKVTFNAKNGLGVQRSWSFNARPEDLFIVNYKKIKLPWFTLYEPQLVDVKPMWNPLPPMFGWDLDNYASTVAIDFEEVDTDITTVVEETRNVTFATNFGIDSGSGTGLLKKIGIKFGATREDKRSQTTRVSYTEGSDALNGIIVNFADQVILERQSLLAGFDVPSYRRRQYDSGRVLVMVEPVRVQ